MSARSGRGPWWVFAIAISTVGVVPLAALTYLVESRATDSVGSEVRDRLSSTAKLTALFLDEQIRGIEEVVNSYARRLRLISAVTALEGPDVVELTRQMNELREARGDVLNVAGIADLAGTMIGGTVPTGIGTDFSDRVWHQTVLRTEAPYVSEAFVGQSPGQPLAVSIAAPVVNADGSLVAIIVVGYTLDKLQQFVDSFVAERGSDVTVTDQTGVVIAQPGAPPTSLESRAHEPIIALALAGESGVVDDARDSSGQRLLAAYAPVPRLGWTVTAERSQAEAYAQAAAMRTQMILIIVPLAGLIMLASVFLARAVRARQVAERQARSSADQFRLLLDSTDDGIWGVDPKGRFMFVNAAAAATFGFEVNELVGQRAHQLVHHHRRDGTEYPWEECPTWRTLHEGAASRTDEETLWRRDGTSFPAEYSSQPLFAGGDIAGAVVVFSDITERIAAEENLRAYRLIFESAGDGILITSPTGEVISSNPAAREILRMSEAEIRRRGRGGLADPTDERWRLNAQQRDTMASFRGERRMLRGDGSTFVADISAARFDVKSGRQLAAVLFRDVTDRADLIEEKARVAAAAEEASRLKSEFLATMSHEIRTPMNGVIGMTGLLLDTELTAEQRDYADVVRTSGEALLSILNDILDFSKIEAGQLQLEEVDFDLGLVTEEVAELLTASSYDKGLELTVQIDPALPDLCRGDPGRVRQILINLLGNAIKFTERGVIRLSVAAVATKDAEMAARFEVRDTGIGITPEAQRRLFDRFVQADATTTRRYGGTGLGLAICKRLVEMMGGEIGVESVLGEGSTFWFSVPLRLSAGLAPPRPKTLVGTRALVVDDLAVNRMALAAQLAAWGISEVGVGSGEAALAKLAGAQGPGERFDIVLSDFQMPGMDGLELADAIAQTVADPPPVIVLSSAGGRDSTLGRSAGSIAQFLVKPARRSLLFDAIATALGEAPSRRVASPAVAAERPSADGAGRRLLVVDDNELNQRLAMLLLQKAGYQVNAVRDGAQAVQAVRSGGYDAVLMDCEMPVMDGYTAAAEIRRHEAGRQRVPIIAVTASAMKGDVERAMAAGMDAHIAKPIDRDELLQVLQELLDDDPAPSAPMDVVSALLDRSALDQLRELDDDGEALRSLAEIFIRNAPDRVAQLSAAAQADDAPGVAAAAHSLRGSAATIGANELAELAADIEHDARAGHTPPPDIVERLKLLLASAVSALSEEIEGRQDRGKRETR